MPRRLVGRAGGKFHFHVVRAIDRDHPFPAVTVLSLLPIGAMGIVFVRFLACMFPLVRQNSRWSGACQLFEMLDFDLTIAAAATAVEAHKPSALRMIIGDHSFLPGRAPCIFLTS